VTKLYLLTFDPSKTNSVDLHNIINGNPYVQDWWHYIATSYIIASDYTLGTLHKDIMTRWPKQRYLLTEVNLDNSNGWLPQAAWDWIHKNR
jgi:hypothetical protein